MAEVLRPGVLDGVAVAIAGGDAFGAGARCKALGALVSQLPAELVDEEAVIAAAAGLHEPRVLVCDAASPFVAAGGGMDGMRIAVDGSWNAARAVANAHWIPGDAGGKLLLLAPAAGAGEHAAAVAAALENTARTLSIEWARYGITSTAIVPASATTAATVAELVAFVASPAGDYYSGCAFTLTG